MVYQVYHTNYRKESFKLTNVTAEIIPQSRATHEAASSRPHARGTNALSKPISPEPCEVASPRPNATFKPIALKLLTKQNDRKSLTCGTILATKMICLDERNILRHELLALPNISYPNALRRYGRTELVTLRVTYTNYRR